MDSLHEPLKILNELGATKMVVSRRDGTGHPTLPGTESENHYATVTLARILGFLVQKYLYLCRINSPEIVQNLCSQRSFSKICPLEKFKQQHQNLWLGQ